MHDGSAHLVMKRNLRQQMSNVRHSDKPSVRGYAVTHPPGRAVLPIEDGWDQLLYTARGTMTVASGAGSWTIPPRRALWIPGGVPVEIVNRFPVAVRTLYFATALRALPPGARMIDVTGLVRELLLYAVRTAPLHSDDRLDRALLHLLVDQLHRAPDAALWLPSPAASDAARAAARLITDRPGMPLPEVARAVGASRRTLERGRKRDAGNGIDDDDGDGRELRARLDADPDASFSQRRRRTWQRHDVCERRSERIVHDHACELGDAGADVFVRPDGVSRSSAT